MTMTDTAVKRVAMQPEELISCSFDSAFEAMKCLGGALTTGPHMTITQLFEWFDRCEPAVEEELGPSYQTLHKITVGQRSYRLVATPMVWPQVVKMQMHLLEAAYADCK